jgi:hypothetical protein
MPGGSILPGYQQMTKARVGDEFDETHETQHSEELRGAEGILSDGPRSMQGNKHIHSGKNPFPILRKFLYFISANSHLSNCGRREDDEVMTR